MHFRRQSCSPNANTIRRTTTNTRNSLNSAICRMPSPTDSLLVSLYTSPAHAMHMSCSPQPIIRITNANSFMNLVSHTLTHISYHTVTRISRANSILHRKLVIGAWDNQRVILRRKRSADTITEVFENNLINADRPTKMVFEIGNSKSHTNAHSVEQIQMIHSTRTFHRRFDSIIFR